MDEQDLEQAIFTMMSVELKEDEDDEGFGFRLMANFAVIIKEFVDPKILREHYPDTLKEINVVLKACYEEPISLEDEIERD